MTLRDVKVDSKASWRGSYKKKNYGYGNHKRNQHLCP